MANSELNLPLPDSDLPSPTLSGPLEVVGPDLHLPDALRFRAEGMDGTVCWTFAPGALATFTWLTADLLLYGHQQSVFHLRLRGGEAGRSFTLCFALLNQVSARIRFELAATDQRSWQLGRQAAWLKPMCYGDPVDLRNVDRMELVVARQGTEPTEWAMTAWQATEAEPAALTEPILPSGPVLDDLGQSRLRDWPGKTASAAERRERLHAQRRETPQAAWPGRFSEWGGDVQNRSEATGWFRTEHDGTRWWLVAPDGCRFWSTGMDCVRPAAEASFQGLEPALSQMPSATTAIRTGARGPMAHYLLDGFADAFGDEAEAAWGEIALGLLRSWGFNTVANWSDWELASQGRLPYVRPLEFRPRRASTVFRDFPDVFHPDFVADAADYAAPLSVHADDPALIGYFLMNEPKWGFASVSPAAGMLVADGRGGTRRRLVAWLRERYPDEARLRAAWGPDAGWTALEAGAWRGGFTPEATSDLEAFSTLMIRRQFDTLSAAGKQVLPHHLNLGARYHIIPPDWALRGMGGFDVFSINMYQPEPDAEGIARLSAAVKRPVMIGEWHFGALDVGLPGASLRHVASQADRAAAYRRYLECAAAHPDCVGAHYFQLYDQSALGRFDGENWNLGFLDVCNRPYPELTEAARQSHERLYDLAAGTVPPVPATARHLPMNVA